MVALQDRIVAQDRVEHLRPQADLADRAQAAARLGQGDATALARHRLECGQRAFVEPGDERRALGRDPLERRVHLDVRRAAALALGLDRLGFRGEVHLSGLQRRGEVVAFHHPLEDEVFDLLDLGVFILDAELRPSFLNKRAEALVRASDGLCFSRGVLSTAAAPTTTILRRAVKNAIGLQRYRGQADVEEVYDAVSELEIARPSGRPPLISTVMPLGVENSERLLMPPAHAIVFVKQPDDKPRLDLDRLANIFGLSPRQAALTGLLAQGATLADAAAALGIGFETARWHLRTTFDKTGTRRQVDLVRLVLQTRAPVSA